MALGASDASKGGRRYAKVRTAGIARYPFLGDLPSLGIASLDLMYHEAEIIRLAMEDLMDNHGIGFLPVHDALMVAKGNETIAAEALGSAFTRYFRDILGKANPPVPRIS